MRRTGFTLIELMVTVSVAAILLTVGVPSFRDLIAANQLATQSNAFSGFMNLARSEAVKRGVRVSVCASDSAASGNGSQTLCTGAWNNGWVAFTDADGDCTIDAGADEKLRVDGKLAGSTLAATRTDTPAAVTCTGYLASGLSATTSADIRFTLCNQSLKKARVIEFSRTGRLRKTDATC